MKYVYGPVRSRRLGNSLGISTIPYKVCSFDCVYCQLKKTTQETLCRRDYIPAADILEEVRAFFRDPAHERVDCVTFSGSGEPTLHSKLGALIRDVRTIASLPIVVITNGSTMTHPAARREIAQADIVIPSLDAVTQGVFEKIDRPPEGLRVQGIIEGLIKFRKVFKGALWLEVMLVRGLNDSLSYLKKIKIVADKIRPEKVHINSPSRPPAESWVRPATARRLAQTKKIFGATCEVV